MTINDHAIIEPRCKPGDLWALGEHRLYCGDSTDRQSIQRLLNGAVIDAVITDPPYCSGGWQEAGKGNGSIGTTAKPATLHNDQLSTRGYVALLKEAIMLSGAKMIHIFTDWRMWCYLFDLSESSGYKVRAMVVWDKQYHGMGIGWRSQHELILVGVKGKNHFDLKIHHGNVISCARTGNRWHPTEKPIDLIEKLIYVAHEAQTIYDPFAGSGTTILAAHNQGRRCYAAEISPEFCDVALHRYEQATGANATLIDHS